MTGRHAWPRPATLAHTYGRGRGVVLHRCDQIELAQRPGRLALVRPHRPSGLGTCSAEEASQAWVGGLCWRICRRASGTGAVISFMGVDRRADIDLTGRLQHCTAHAVCGAGLKDSCLWASAAINAVRRIRPATHHTIYCLDVIIRTNLVRTCLSTVPIMGFSVGHTAGDRRRGRSLGTLSLASSQQNWAFHTGAGRLGIFPRLPMCAVGVRDWHSR
jgi:hypothetical protein